MTRHVALIRGINNIGRSKRVAMADLKREFERLGFREVRTVMNSGNVVFATREQPLEAIAGRIEKGLAARLGLSVRVIVLSAREVAAAVRRNPLAGIASSPSRLLVAVPRRRPDRHRLRPLLEARWAPEALAVGDRVAYLWCANGVARSPLRAAVDRALERTGTFRNIATFTKAAGLVRAGRRKG